MTTQDDLEFARSNTLLTARIMRSAGFLACIGENETTVLIRLAVCNVTKSEVMAIIEQEELPINECQLVAFPGAVLIDLSEV